MTDENTTEQTSGDQPKTAYDVRIEKLEQRLEEMEQAHREEREKWQKANRDLYSLVNGQLPQQGTVQGQEPPAEPTAEGFAKMFKKKE